MTTLPTTRMMPDQLQYTEEEEVRKQKMLEAACRAEEEFDLDELERYADARRQRELDEGT